MILRFITYTLIGTALGLLASLAIPASGRTWSSNPSRYFLGADVYPEKDIIAMKDGKLLRLPDGLQPTDPRKFSEWIMTVGRLSESYSPLAIRYYVVPRLHPGLEGLIPAFCMLCVGIIMFAITPKKGKKKPNQALEPTSTAVTPPASAGDRASGTRGSS